MDCILVLAAWDVSEETRRAKRGTKEVATECQNRIGDHLTRVKGAPGNPLTNYSASREDLILTR